MPGRKVGGLTGAGLAFLCFACVASGNSFDSGIFQLFPGGVDKFAYVDLSQARSFPWYAQLQSQLMPVAMCSFERFLTSPPMGVNTQVDAAAWATASEDENVPAQETPQESNMGAAQGIMGVAVGQFNPETAEAYLRDGKFPSEEFDHYTAYASAPGNGVMWFTILDSNTVIFGPRILVEKMISAHESKEANLSQNAAMMALINGARTDGMFWGAFDGNAAQQAIRELAPEAAAFSGGPAMIGKLSALLMNIDVSSQTNLEIRIRATAASPSDAMAISQVLSAAMLIRSYAAKNDNPDLAGILDTSQVTPSGTEVEINLTPGNDQLLGLVEHDTFASKP